MVVLQGQERHKEINEVLFQEVAAGVTVLCSKTRDKKTSETSSESWHISARQGLSLKGLPWLAHPYVVGDTHSKSWPALGLHTEHRYSLAILGQEKPESPEKPWYFLMVLGSLLHPGHFQG